ncbi:MAG: PAS domain S-box protein [Gammaproteobacteria bacterium]|nr:PAS domain S-box protein [Gammaproteobacteria bacterium]
MRHILRQILSGLLVFVFIQEAIAEHKIAEQRSLIFDRISTEHGLSQGIVTAIAQDPDGFIWVGTQEGLNRYDGYRFESYYHIEGDESSLSHDYIRSLLFGKDGSLWVGTDAGLNKFDHNKKTFNHFDLGLSNEVVYSLAETSDGDVWIGTSKGLVVLGAHDTAHQLISKFDSEIIGPGRIRAISEMRNGEVWVGTEGNGIFIVDAQGKEVSKPDVLLHDSDIRDILEDSVGRVWVATFNNGVTKIEPESWSVSHYTSSFENRGLGSNRVRDVLEDSQGHIWFATDRGLHFYGGGSHFVRYELDLSNPRSVSDNTIVTLFQDEGGVIWVGTFNGLSKWNAQIELFPYFRRPASDTGSTESNNITSFIGLPNNDVWIGTFSGLMKWDSSSASLVSFEPEEMGLFDRRVMSLGVDGSSVWAGTMTSGVNIIEENKVVDHYYFEELNPSSVSSNAITKIYKDNNGAMWVTTYGGGVNKHIGDGVFRRYPESQEDQAKFSDLRCMDIVQVSDGRYWIATQGGGVIVLDAETGETHVLQHNPNDKSSIPSNEVLSLLSTKDGVWIGTVNRGLSYYNFASRQISRFSKRDGLASDAIYGLLMDDRGMIWASGGKGLSLMDPRTHSFKLFDSTHGLQSSDFNSGAYAKLGDGSLLFGGNNGFNAFYPEKVKLNGFVPPVHITSFKLFNEKIQILPGQRIQLDFDDTVLGFEFAALDYTAPKKNQYRYKLEGFDRDWVHHQGDREVTYTNLDAGAYVFRVQGSNNDGVWNREGASLELLVQPAPWLTWWAYCIYLVTVAFGFYLLWRSNSERLKREAERRYSERLQLYIESLEEASDCILIADASGTLLYANNTITEGLNKSPSEVIGESLWTVLFEDEKDVEAARESLLDEGRYHGEVQLDGTDGATVTHEVTIAAVQQSSTNDMAYVGISRDVTERKVTEAELEDYRKNLEQLVEERTKALQKEIAENKAIQVHLAESLQEKELLIKEVHHRVKNNMQVISSLLSIQAEGAEDELYSHLLHESQQRIKSMALIHETLYQSKDLLKIDFQEYIETLTTSLNRSYSVPGVSVHVAVNVENVSLDLETAVPCGLVINELVSNSLKHAFHGKEGTGIIDIRFVSNDCHYDLRISDNGLGLPEGFDPNKNASMGMEIVSILTMQLEGNLEAHNEAGAVFEIRFPRRANG